MESHGTFRTLLNPIKQLMLRRSKLGIYGTSRSMELPSQWNFPLGFLLTPFSWPREYTLIDPFGR